MNARLIQDEHELAGLVDQWQALGPATPMMSPTWLLTWWERFVPQSSSGKRPQLFTLAVTDSGGRLLGLAPWYVARETGNQRVVQFLGSGAVSSDHLTVLCRSGDEHEVASQVADCLFHWPARGLWDRLDLNGTDRQDPVMQSLIAAFQNQRDALISMDRATSTWHLDLPETWEDYLDRLSKNRRKRLRRLERSYFDTGRCGYHVLEQESELDEYFSQLVTLHNRRRRSLGEPGAFDCSRFLAFHRNVMPKLLAEGMLHLSLLYLDGQPIAAEYLLRQDDALYAYQSGLEPTAIEHSPGGLSLLATLRTAIESGIRRFDLLRGDEPYKAHWSAVPREAMRVRIRQRSVLGQIQHLVDRLKSRARHLRNGTQHSAVDGFARSSTL